jgi:hypothetical protein
MNKQDENEEKAWKEHENRKRGGINDHFCDNCFELFHHDELTEYTKMKEDGLMTFWISYQPVNGS